jgi:phosphoribosyl 1,2-cyclic phosphodiesterase
MQICPLGSGSSGNSIYFRAGETRLLIDAGLPGQIIVRSLATLGVAVGDIAGVFVTHEHTDHLRGIPLLARKYNLPVYASNGTADELAWMLPDNVEVRRLPAGGMRLGELDLHHFSVPHDAADPVGYIFEHDGMRVTVATDLGCVTKEIKKALSGSQMIVLESNHDEEMLANGPYPEHLKQRIRSTHGHLSNRQAADALKSVWHEDLHHVVLAHISRENNDPILARDTVSKAFDDGAHPAIHLTAHYEVGPFLEI